MKSDGHQTTICIFWGGFYSTRCVISYFLRAERSFVRALQGAMEPPNDASSKFFLHVILLLTLSLFCLFLLCLFIICQIKCQCRKMECVPAIHSNNDRTTKNEIPSHSQTSKKFSLTLFKVTMFMVIENIADKKEWMIKFKLCNINSAKI